MNNGSGSKNRWMMGLHLKGRKERDNEDLHLFRDLHKRDKERTTCFLLPVDELEHNHGGTYQLHDLHHSNHYQFCGILHSTEFTQSRKNLDLDTFLKATKTTMIGIKLIFSDSELKTPPATPLFPSLEMEATAPSHRNAQKETPLVQPLSQPQSQSGQASSNSESTKKSNVIEKSPTTKPKIPSRSITPSHRPRINSSIEPKNTKRTTTPSPNPIQRINQASSIDPTIKRNNNMKPINLKECYTEYLTSNLYKGSTNTAKPKANPNPRSRTTSPIVRSTIASQIPEFSNETPPNLRTDRSSSVTRGRQPGTGEKSEANSRRQSCSPSVTRGRKVEGKQEKNRGGNLSNDQRRNESTNILGSRMVERVMNARKGIGNEERDLKPSGRSGIGDFSQTIRQR
ncbi:BUD13 homolog [Benincasa hispida]|uniref:BUD13 homolog n=1 Tax=Benincasa hispida TaxID=102211 RepID=UPI001900504C|nr:BUD13 homolog [Benincasa hispida]